MTYLRGFQVFVQKSVNAFAQLRFYMICYWTGLNMTTIEFQTSEGDYKEASIRRNDKYCNAYCLHHTNIGEQCKILNETTSFTCEYFTYNFYVNAISTLCTDITLSMLFNSHTSLVKSNQQMKHIISKCC